MSIKEFREQMTALQKVHEGLGDSYIEMCASSDVEPLPVVWSTYPPLPTGQTQAYVMFGYEEETNVHGQTGIDVFAETRAELVHLVFLRVLSLRCVN